MEKEEGGAATDAEATEQSSQRRVLVVAETTESRNCSEIRTVVRKEVCLHEMTKYSPHHMQDYNQYTLTPEIEEQP